MIQYVPVARFRQRLDFTQYLFDWGVNVLAITGNIVGVRQIRAGCITKQSFSKPPMQVNMASFVLMELYRIGYTPPPNSIHVRRPVTLPLCSTKDNIHAFFMVIYRNKMNS